MALLRVACGSALMAVMLLAGCGRSEVATDCDLRGGACIKGLGGGISVSFDLNPKPLKTMSELTCTVVLRKAGTAVTGAGVVIELSMPGMLMADNRARLYDKGEGVYAGKVVIVRCPSGRTVWRAAIVVDVPGGPPLAVDYTFRVGG